jgi:hypothetical protein
LNAAKHSAKVRGTSRISQFISNSAHSPPTYRTMGSFVLATRALSRLPEVEKKLVRVRE